MKTTTKGSRLFAGFLIGVLTLGILGNTGVLRWGPTNFDHLVLGTGNYEADPNPTADITFQNDEYITNSVDGTLNFGAANLATTGTFQASALSAGLGLGGYALTNGASYGFSSATTVKPDSGDTGVDTLRLASVTGTYILVRSGTGTGTTDSVQYVKNPIARTLYIFQAVNTDTTIVFVDGGNLKLGATRALDATGDVLILWSDGTNLFEVAFDNNE